MFIKRIIKKIFLTRPTRNVKENFYLKENANYSKYDIGIGTYGKPRISDWSDGTSLIIGNYCSIASNVNILLGGEHHSDWVTTYPFKTLKNESDHLETDKKSKGSVTIGNDVWIGMNSIILSGVHIGNGAIIGTGSVVTKDVPSYAIYAGNPARLIRFRFGEDIINELNEISWWHWNEDKIAKNYHLLLSENINDFIEKHRK